jgi:hypothetical protein
MIHRTPRARALGEDLVLLAMPVLVLLITSPSPWLWLLATTGLVVLAFNAITLHFPREIDLDERGIRFRAYGREHAYTWTACRLRVRRFLVRDRVLLRVEEIDSGKTHRYWLTARLSDYDALLRELGTRAV